ncbi:L-2,4-diaminobutyrate decarboxylase [Arachidicoccus rhizosphaerae]|uniref:L-2,4-diaminobutyrate decarboxylase n=1 Tax=Arachidicoccus rhizosphaerae TaxID=551991 RepID=A0A1H4C7W1_9BACT|nr:pyridoxal-dependent decarboxylase [Arachidicoccus rhizosphaerae]SEA56420.1 L-2,4-diaminobutyrate decarboxylase [Arachidicoccus rhizosphaerae]
MTPDKDLLEAALSIQEFESAGKELLGILKKDMQLSVDSLDNKTIDYICPEDQLNYWQDDFYSQQPVTASALFKTILDRSIKLSRRGYVGHQVAPVYPISILSSALSAYLNNGMAVYEMGMAGNAMEKIIIADLAKRFGLPDTATGFVTSGGSLGNLTALLAARAHYLQRQQPSVNYQKLAIMVSEEAHYSIQRAMIIMGLSVDNILKIPINEKGQISIEQLTGLLEKAQKNDWHIFALIGCSCTTSSGSYEDLITLGHFCREQKIWLHVDAAHGGPAIYSNKYKALLAGSEAADSIIMDFHKMMHVPSLSTAVIFRTAAHHKATFSQNAKYLWEDQTSDQWYNSGKQTFECTKPMSIIHTYIALRLYGDKFYAQHIEYLYDLTKNFADLIDQHPLLELLCTPQSNIVCFRYTGDLQRINEINKHILSKIIHEGKFYLVSTSTGGNFYLRTTIMNPRTTISDLEKLLNSVVKFATSV